jgi:hypothetical protein
MMGSAASADSISRTYNVTLDDDGLIGFGDLVSVLSAWGPFASTVSPCGKQDDEVGEPDVVRTVER